MNLKDKIFELFGYRDSIEDLNKINGKGFFQRFNELLADDMDDNEIDKMMNLLYNLIDPYTISERFIPLRNDHLGMKIYFSDEIEIIRKTLTLLIDIYSIKGTINGYKTLFRIIGINGQVTIIEYTLNTGFDSPIKLDDPIRKLDSYKATCSPYSIILTGTLPLTSGLIDGIKNIVIFNEPISARLIEITYNGVEINITPKGRSFNESFAIAFS